VIGTATIVERGAQSVQLEGANDFARIHVRTRDGGVVAVMHPRTARVLAKRVIDERSIRHDDALAGKPWTFGDAEATSGEITIKYEHRRLVIRRGTAWYRYLRVIESDAEKMLHRVTLQRVGDRVIVSIHDTDASKVEVFAYDHDSGKAVWQTAVTGAERLAFMGASITAGIDDDQVVIGGAARGRSFVCTIGLHDGVERACVDRVDLAAARSTVFELRDDDIVTP
jgi:hypothetical protein